LIFPVDPRLATGHGRVADYVAALRQKVLDSVTALIDLLGRLGWEGVWKHQR
jgi:hypothetical protein